MTAVAEMPCLVSHQSVIQSHKCAGRTTVHHVSASIHGGRLPRSHALVVPLCERHHLIQHGPRESVEALGHAGFHLIYGIDLLAVAERLWVDGGAS